MSPRLNNLRDELPSATYQSELRKALATQHAIIILEKQITNLGAVPITYQHPERERRVAETETKSTTCEAKSAPQPEVGRNSPCPCGSGLKYKRRSARFPST